MSCGVEWPNWKAGSRSERNNGTPAGPHLRFDLLRNLQNIQNPSEPVVAGDRDARRNPRHRIYFAGHELQSSVHEECAYLFHGHTRSAVGERPRDRGAGAAQYAAQGG